MEKAAGSSCNSITKSCISVTMVDTSKDLEWERSGYGSDLWNTTWNWIGGLNRYVTCIYICMYIMYEVDVYHVCMIACVVVGVYGDGCMSYQYKLDMVGIHEWICSS